MDHLRERRTFRLRSGPKVLNLHTAQVSIFPRKSAQKGITGMFLSGAPMGTTCGMGILVEVPFSEVLCSEDKLPHHHLSTFVPQKSNFLEKATEPA